MLGMVDEAIPLIKHFDVGVISSESEGLSNSLIEYVGCGIPVVATDIPANRELLGESACLYPVGDTERLSSLLCEVLSNGKGRAAATRNYRDILEKDFDIGKNHKKLEELYLQLVDRQ